MLQTCKRVLAPMDFSEYSFKAMQNAWDLAKEVGAELHLIHVVPPPHPLLPLKTSHDMAREATLIEEAEEEFARIKKDQLEDSIKVLTTVVPGAPAAKIADYAGQRHIDLIVMATHGHGGFEKVFRLGSIADRVLRHAPCPILLIRAET